MNTVLYIEDSEPNIKLVGNILDRIGDIQYISSNSASNGLDIIHNTNIDIILMDINLPNMDGYDLLKNIKQIENKQGVPVVAITGNAMPQDVSKLIKSGFDHYLIKPFDINELTNIVRGYTKHTH